MKTLGDRINEVEDREVILNIENYRLPSTQIQKFFDRYGENWRQKHREKQERDYFKIMGDI